jgi:hypothetical protein
MHSQKSNMAAGCHLGYWPANRADTSCRHVGRVVLSCTKVCIKFGVDRLNVGQTVWVYRWERGKCGGGYKLPSPPRLAYAYV